MQGTPIKRLARDLKLPVADLMARLRASGVDVTSEDDQISGEQQLRLLKLTQTSDQPEGTQQVKKKPSAAEQASEVSVADIESAEDLETLNGLLTRAMADRKVQALIKDDNLETIVQAILHRAAEDEQPLLAAAVLGRLAAVVRAEARAALVYERADELLPDEPESLLELPDTDGSMKQYAAQMLAHVTAPWAADYRYREALAIDTADIARRALLGANLELEGNISAWLRAVVERAAVLDEVKKRDARLKRLRRIFGVMRDVADLWRGDVGFNVGASLVVCFDGLLPRGKGFDDLDQSDLFAAVDNLLEVLSRVIQLRFSTALNADTYALLEQGRRALGSGLWGRFLIKSDAIGDIRVALLEAALVLARQDKYDNDMMAVLRSAYVSRAQMTSALQGHFADAKDLDPSVSEWWRKGGGGDGGKEQAAQRIRNSEDEKIGELLLKVEASETVMGKLRSAVVPILQSMNPVLAKTVEKAARDYHAMAQEVNSLARMRQLKTAGLMSERLEYSRRLHDMEGGHRSGVRYIKVVRDGVEKTFAGKTKLLVKPIVEPEE